MGTQKVGTVNRIKPYFVEDIIPILRSVLFSNGSPHPEFVRAILAVAMAFGITKEDIEKG